MHPASPQDLELVAEANFCPCNFKVPRLQSSLKFLTLQFQLTCLISISQHFILLKIKSFCYGQALCFRLSLSHSNSALRHTICFLLFIWRKKSVEYEKQRCNHTDKPNSNKDHLSETSQIILGSTSHPGKERNFSSYHSN